MDNSQIVFNWFIGGGSALFGWAMKFLYDKLHELQVADLALAEKVQGIEVLVAGQYVKRSDLEKVTDALFNKLDRIENKLDGKVDRSGHA